MHVSLLSVHHRRRRLECCRLVVAVGGRPRLDRPVPGLDLDLRLGPDLDLDLDLDPELPAVDAAAAVAVGKELEEGYEVPAVVDLLRG